MNFTESHRPAALALAALLTLGAATAARADAEPQRPLERLPYTPSLDTEAMDRSADPCEDLYQFACGGWMQRNPIPADQSRWSVYAKLADENRRYLWGILEKLAAGGAERTPSQARIGDYFAACMDEDAVERRGLAPLKPWLARIDALSRKDQLPELLAALHLAHNNARFFFRFGAGQDLADSSRVIAFAYAGGLSLPDRSYYLDQTPKARQMRAQFLDHVARNFERLGDEPAAARRQAREVLAQETRLARASMSPVEQRDPYKSFHPMDARGLRALTPGFDWGAYQRALGLEAPQRYNVTEPAFFRALARQWQDLTLTQIRSSLRWQLVSSQAPALDRAMVQLHFDFFGQTLHGIPQLKARWKRCVEGVDQQLGEDLGREFVERNFSPELKEQTLRMTQQIEQAMAQRIAALDWMGPDTKKRAQEKLHAIVNKVGYPERWRDYGAYRLAADDHAGNVERGHEFEARRQLAKIGKPLERGEWGMTPQTVNAYYDAQMNDINFPAGVLQPPLFDPKTDDGPNYGNTGGTIGHELIHGFDDEGRQFDAKGNLRDWWTAKDNKAFEKRAACVADQYARYTVVDDLKINSKLTLGEDLADLGGLVLAWAAWQTQVAELSAQGRAPAERDGLTPAQRFFVGFAQWDCSHARPEALRVSARTDPHSPGRYRINGVAVNMPEFQQAFACKPGQKMVKPDAQRCRIW